MLKKAGCLEEHYKIQVSLFALIFLAFGQLDILLCITEPFVRF